MTTPAITAALNVVQEAAIQARETQLVADAAWDKHLAARKDAIRATNKLDEAQNKLASALVAEKNTEE